MTNLFFCFNESKKEGEDQESIQVSTTPDPGHGKVTKHKKISHTREPGGQPFLNRYCILIPGVGLWAGGIFDRKLLFCQVFM